MERQVDPESNQRPGPPRAPGWELLSRGQGQGRRPEASLRCADPAAGGAAGAPPPALSPPQGSRAGREPTASNQPRLETAALPPPHPPTRDAPAVHRTAASVSGCQAELCELKKPNPLLPGLLNCLPGEARGLLVTDSRACPPAPDREALITWKTPDTRAPNDE